MRGKMNIIISSLILVLNFPIFSQDNASILKLDFPLFDLPYQIDAMKTVGHGFFSSYANPSMDQSLSITTNVFSGFHYGMKIFYNKSNISTILKNIIYYGGTAAGDIVLFFLPFGSDSWMHEEFHRAVMSRYGVNSFNTVYTLGPLLGNAYVNHVADEDLERFKKESFADFVRLHEAGFEGEFLLMEYLQKNNFFYNQQYFNELVYWFITLNTHQYIWGSAFGNAFTGKGENIMRERDFTGSDPVAWVYDLFRADEPYSARGVHPTGIGIDRYRQKEDLSARELDYFRKTAYWYFANYLSPMMIGFRSLPWGETNIRWNFFFRHFLTSFGTDLSLNVFLNIDKYNFVAVYHNYQNYEHIFPAIEFEMIDYPLGFNGFRTYVSPRIMIGLQPKEQEFFTSEVEFFGLISSRIDFQINTNWLPYLEVIGKTDGWVVGNEFLNKNVSIKLGVSARF
jgi:hypothetical protein